MGILNYGGHLGRHLHNIHNMQTSDMLEYKYTQIHSQYGNRSPSFVHYANNIIKDL